MALTWNRVILPATASWQNVRHIRNGIFIANSGRDLARSVDGGKTWSAVTAPSTSMGGIASDGKGRVVIACDLSIAVSTDDGATWTTNTHGLGSYLKFICYDSVHGTFIAIPSAGAAAFYSSDGVTWTRATLPSSQVYTAIAAGNGMVALPCQDNSGVFISYDGGATWTGATFGTSRGWSDVRYGDDRFIVTVSETDDARSTFGYLLTNKTAGYGNLPTTGYWSSVAYGMGKWIVLNRSGATYLMSENNGTSWTAYALTNGFSYEDVDFGENSFVMVCSGVSNTAFYAIVNNAPNSPATIDVPASIQGGSNNTVTWSEATDPENNLAGYVLERSVEGGEWQVIYRGTLRSYVDTITFGWASVAYRVKAYDVYSAESGYTTSAVRAINNNTPPAITGSDGNLGAFSTAFTAQAYTVTDAQSDPVTVVERVDGVVKRSFTATLGAANSFSFTAADWQKVLNGNHTITITATDSKGTATVRTWTFTKAMNTATFTITPLPADAMPDRCVVNAVGNLPAGSTLKVEVCNNANDASPTWEDVSGKLGLKHFFTNKSKTAAEWGFGLRCTLTRGTATGSVWLDYINITYR